MLSCNFESHFQSKSGIKTTLKILSTIVPAKMKSSHLGTYTFNHFGITNVCIDVSL